MILSEIRKGNTDYLEHYLLSKFRGKVHDPYEEILISAYMVIMQKFIPDYDILMKSVCFPESRITPEIKDVMDECRDVDDISEFAELLLFYEFDHSVPAGISEMMLRLCGDHKEAAAAVCGDISAVRDALISDPSVKKITLCDTAFSDIAKMRADVINRLTDTEIELTGRIDEGRYSMVISNYLLSDRPYTRLDPAFDLRKGYFPFETDGISYEWKIHSFIIRMLSGDGSAAVVTTAGAVSNRNESYIRKYFAEKGFIETVIALPPKLFGYTPIRSVMIKFSFGNTKIKFIDSGNSFTAGRRINTLSSENITDILENSNFTEISTDDERLTENGYCLDPLIYLKEKPDISNAVPFGSVMLSVTRGMQLNAADIDELEVMERAESYCGYRYLKIADLHDCMISSDLPYLKYLPEGAEKYCTRYGDIIISKTGKPAKAAVAGFNDEDILVTGNMYIIRPDKKLADPYYLLAFLTSETGHESLRRISGGSTLCTISLSALKNMMIPLPDMDTQLKIAEQYREKLNELSELRRSFVQKKEELRKIFK